MYKACIFDLDGTLTDTLESLTYSVNATLKELGLQSITSTQCKSFVGDGARCLMERALKAAGDCELLKMEEAMERYGCIFGENCTYHVTPYEGIMDMLRRLKDMGIRSAVLSNKPHAQTVDVVEAIFGRGTFTYVQGQCEEIGKKPSPEGVFFLLEQLKVSKAECLYVGDSDVDMKTGNVAGLKTVGVNWGFRTREILIAAGAGYTIDKPEELFSIL